MDLKSAEYDFIVDVNFTNQQNDKDSIRLLLFLFFFLNLVIIIILLKKID